MIFQWDDDNIAHIAGHGVGPEEAEYVVEHAMPMTAGQKRQYRKLKGRR